MADDKDIKNQLREISSQLRTIDGRLDQQGETLIRQEENIKHHIYRTDLAEENIKLIKSDIEPIKKHVTMVEGVLKFFGGVALVAGVLAGIVQILEFLSKS